VFEDIQKAQQGFEDLVKLDPELSSHLKALRTAAPKSAEFLARKLFVDHMVDGVGNKAAYEDFLSRPRQGVHVMMDANDFGLINKRWGQSVGDDAIKAMGGALQRASRANRGKLFRVGGDEFRAFFETPEHAHSFVRHMRDEMERLQPVKGTNHHSMSVGLASSPDEAEQAVIHAKNAKKGMGYAPGHAMTHVHSLLPGAAGPVPVSKPPDIPAGVKRPIQPGQSPLPIQTAAAAEPMPPMHKGEEEEKPRDVRARRKSGQYSYQGKWDRLCVCGAKLGDHMAAAPHDYDTTGCEGFRPAKTKKSEFDDLAWQAELRKMAVIHDDAQQPMKVWRVQNDEGQGPYYGSDSPAWRMNIKGPKTDRPDPYRDFDDDDLDEWNQANPGGMLFGFHAPEHAEKWFGSDALTALRQHGFTLRQVLARKVYQSRSGKQVMFEPHA
jgi:diguanylate cyclase (GGDEF)-like protein